MAEFSAAECNNRLVRLEDFYKKIVLCETFFVKIFKMNQPVVTFGSREYSTEHLWYG